MSELSSGKPKNVTDEARSRDGWTAEADGTLMPGRWCQMPDGDKQFEVEDERRWPVKKGQLVHLRLPIKTSPRSELDPPCTFQLEIHPDFSRGQRIDGRTVPWPHDWMLVGFEPGL
jgi:hypothetical protein